MATGQPSTRLIMTWEGGRSENDQFHHQNSFYSFSINTYKEISISLDSFYARDLEVTSVEEEVSERGL